MERALYDPQDGYYARGPGRIGRGGDFFTASDVGRGFGRCVAAQLSEIDRTVGPFDPFDVLEFGSGRGLLARDVLDAMSELNPGLARRLRYRMVDRSAAMREAAQCEAPEAETIAPERLGDGYRGCVLAVELFDALPVHRLRRSDGRLREIYVDLDEHGALVEREGDPSEALVRLADRYGVAAEDGLEAEVAPGAITLFDAMQRLLDRGVLLFVDYGDAAGELYCAARGRGTLLAYHNNRTNQQYLERVGEQDLTAHVNFTLLTDRARECGLSILGTTTQDRFLIANGILDAFDVADAEWGRPRRVKQRLQAMQLIHPNGMGRMFKVLMLAKGCDPPPELNGLRDPFA